MKKLLLVTSLILLASRRLGANRAVFNPSRNTDDWGSGSFGASRDGGTRPHLGTDYTVTEGEVVYAPFDMEIYSGSYPYAGNLSFKGVKFNTKINGVDYNGRIWYFVPYTGIVGSMVSKGDPVGVAQSLQSKYPGITDHIHVHLSTAVDVSNQFNTMLYEGRYYINPSDVV